MRYLNKKEVKFVDLRPQYLHNKAEIDRQIEEVIYSSGFIMGEKVEELEETLSLFINVKNAIGVGSGTDALMVSLLAAGIGNGDTVITTPFSFIAAAEAIALVGAIPVFVDIEPLTFNMDIEKLEYTIRKVPGIKAICPVSLYGQPADLDDIMLIAEKEGLLVIEDGCQSFGSEYRGRKSCGVTHIGVTSFFPSKPLGCFGDGGMIFTDDNELALKMRAIRVHGEIGRYHHKFIGLNARLDTLQAAVLLGKFPAFEEEMKKRHKIAELYSNGLKDKVTPPFVKADRKSVYAQYTIKVNKRDEIKEKLSSAGIHTAVHYPTPIHLQTPFKKFGNKRGDFPESEKAAAEVLSLPMHPYLTSSDQKYVIMSLSEAIQPISL